MSKRKRVYFFDQPERLNWTLSDGEVTLFEKNVPIGSNKGLLIDTSITP